MSEEENKELFALGAEGDLWLGGHDLDKEGAWEWTDGSPWRYTTWEDEYGKIGRTSNCLSSIENWWDWDCKDIYPYKIGATKICQIVLTFATEYGYTQAYEFKSIMI